MATKDIEQRSCRAPLRAEPAQLSLLRRGQAGDQRPRIRPDDEPADRARGRASRAGDARQPHPAGRRPAAGRVRDRPARGPDAVDRQHLFVRRGPRVGRSGAQRAQTATSRCAMSSSSRSTASPSRCATSTASSCRARRAATASAATTSRPILKTVREVPLVLHGSPPDLLEVRGEVYMTNSELVRLNELRAAAGDPPFANPRNSTAGSLKMLDSRIVAQRRLRFISHGLGESRGIRRVVVSGDHPVDEDAGASR